MKSDFYRIISRVTYQLQMEIPKNDPVQPHHYGV